MLRLVRGCCLLLALLLTGLALRPLEKPTWEAVRAGRPELQLRDLEGALGQGIVVGVLGGFRAILADFLWIRLNGIWERKERPKMGPMIRLVTRLDPRPDFFWINGARMLAYDVPNWRIRAEGGYDAVPPERQQEIDREQAEQAFRLLESAREFHPENPRMYLEVGQIYLHRLDNVEKAAEWFGKAKDKPGAPYFVARIYAELLRRQDKDGEAYQFLRDLHPTLPAGNPAARKEVVLDRIRTLEETLDIPPEERYRPVRQPPPAGE